MYCVEGTPVHVFCALSQSNYTLSKAESRVRGIICPKHKDKPTEDVIPILSLDQLLGVEAFCGVCLLPVSVRGVYFIFTVGLNWDVFAISLQSSPFALRFRFKSRCLVAVPNIS
jgi:hypothetical protein